MLFGHALPRARVAVLEGKIFGVGTVSENDRISALFHRPEYVRAQHQTVVHRDRDVPVDPHAVADFRALEQHGHDSPPTDVFCARLQRSGGSLQARQARLRRLTFAMLSNTAHTAAVSWPP